MATTRDDFVRHLGQGLGPRALDHTLSLVRHLSVTGTPGEASFAGHLAEILHAWPCFAAHPRNVVVDPVPGAPEGRANVLALLRGKGRRTVVLAGHFDVVGVADYGPNAPLASEPFALRDALIERLRASGEEARALSDLESGAFLPGRGILDMKSGLGAGMAVLEALSRDPDFDGNVILLATPDEENQSAGMRAAGGLLARVAAEHDLDLAFCINLDALQDDGDPRLAQSVGLGCIGKHLVTALVVGHQAHACYPFNGISAAYLASALVTALEYEPDLAEGTGLEASAPPVVLVQSDLREGYDVTTPMRAWCAWNLLTRRRTTAQVMDGVRAVVTRALADALATRAERARRAGVEEAFRVPEIPVVDYETLDARAAAADPHYARAKAELAAALAARADLTNPSRARILTELAFDSSGMVGPAVVIGFGGLSYPAVPPLRDQAPGPLEDLVRETVARLAEAHGVEVVMRDQLPVIVDMSFPGAFDREDDLRATRLNPLWGPLVSWDVLGFPRLPIVNIGPWGRDYHRFVERVHVPYSFGVLPEIVRGVALAVLRDG